MKQKGHLLTNESIQNRQCHAYIDALVNAFIMFNVIFIVIEITIQNVIHSLLNKSTAVICYLFNHSQHLMHSYTKQPALNTGGQLFVEQELSNQSDFTFLLDFEPMQAIEHFMPVESNDKFSNTDHLESHLRTHTGFSKRTECFPDGIKLLTASHHNKQDVLSTEQHYKSTWATESISPFPNRGLGFDLEMGCSMDAIFLWSHITRLNSSTNLLNMSIN